MQDYFDDRGTGSAFKCREKKIKRTSHLLTSTDAISITLTLIPFLVAAALAVKWISTKFSDCAASNHMIQSTKLSESIDMAQLI